MLALKLLQPAVEWNTSHFILWLELGQCQRALGLISLAEISFTQAYQLNPQCHAASLASDQLARAGFWPRARDWCRQLFKR